MNKYFDPFAEKGNEFLEVLAEQMGGTKDVGHAARVLRAVLHTIRDRVPVNVSLQFISSLPMAIKAIYIDGWKAGKKSTPIRNKTDFINAIRAKEKPLLAAYDLKDEAYTGKMIAAVMQTLQLYVSEGEQKDLLAVLPEAMRTYIGEMTTEKFHLL